VSANGVQLQVSRYPARPVGGDVGSEVGRTPPVIVFVHGLTGDHAGWAFTLGMPLSVRGAEVVLYDLRGHGRSELVPSGYRVADHVADLVALLDALDVAAPVHLVGGSYGGVVALAAGVAHPSRVASLTLVEGLLPHPGWGEALAATLDRAAQAFRRDISPEEVMATLGMASARRAAALAARVAQLVLGTTLVAEVRAEPAFGAADYSRIRCPVHGVYGDQGVVQPLGALLQEAVPAAVVDTIAGADHLGVFTHTRTLKAVIGRMTGLAAEPAVSPR
jgi:pimeloyl-ACP methyl ester carboxylesterase